MDTLPVEVMETLLGFIPYASLPALRLVCRYFNKSKALIELLYRKIPLRLSTQSMKCLSELSQHDYAINVQEIIFSGNTFIHLPRERPWRDFLPQPIPEKYQADAEKKLASREEDELILYQKWVQQPDDNEGLVNGFVESLSGFPNLRTFSFHYFLGYRSWTFTGKQTDFSGAVDSESSGSREEISNIPSGVPDHFKRIIFENPAEDVKIELDFCDCLYGVPETQLYHIYPIGVFATLAERFPVAESIKIELAFSMVDCFRSLISDVGYPEAHWYCDRLFPRLDAIYLRELENEPPIYPLERQAKYPFQVLSRAYNLESITIEFASPPSNCTEGYIYHIFGMHCVWRRLRILSLRGVDIHIEQYFELLRRHDETIEEIGLAYINLHCGSWLAVMRYLKNGLPRLRRLELGGKLLDEHRGFGIREFSVDASGTVNTGELKKMVDFVLREGPEYPGVYDVPAFAERWI
ncbi:hypothetical protein RUND412_003669 [Rhizina undulata]